MQIFCFLRRLRVLTGTHPVEPQHRKRVGKGSTFPREYFLKKDVAFVGRNPIIGLLRQKRIFYRKLKRAHERKDEATVKRLQENMPDDTYHIDNIIYDRYESRLRRPLCCIHNSCIEKIYNNFFLLNHVHDCDIYSF